MTKEQREWLEGESFEELPRTTLVNTLTLERNKKVRKSLQKQGIFLKGLDRDIQTQEYEDMMKDYFD